MNSYIVTDPKGITVDGKLIAKGDSVLLPEGPQLDAFLHFNQVEMADESAAESSEKSASPEKPVDTEKPEKPKK